MNVFIKPVDSSIRKAKVLYLMGATWHNRSMFDLISKQPSMASILQSKNIETYTFDIFGSGPGPKEEFIGNQYQANIDYAIELIKQHDIDYIFGYSAGAVMAVDIALKIPIKGIVILDPFANITIPFKETPDGDKYIVERDVVAQALLDYGTHIDSDVIQSYLDSLDNTGTLVTATYPRTASKERFKTFFDRDNFLGLIGKCQIKVIITRGRPQHFERLGIPNLVVRNNSISHWVMLEEGRFWLAKEISEFV
jgi:hypothetical protein